MAPVLLAIFVFLFAAGAIFGIYAAVTRLPAALARRRIDQRIREAAGMPAEVDAGAGTVLKQDAGGPLPLVDQLLAKSVKGAGLARLIEQAGLKISVSTILLASVFLGVICAVVLLTALRQPWAMFAGAGVGCVSPFLYLRHRRTARMKRFEEQFPEALDLLSRAIRAGHAFTTAMSMVAEEAPDPVCREFRKSFDEQNFGLPLKDALNNLADRVPVLDVRFFVTAVLIQRETGGNLAEILDNLAHVVRERFKILRQVRVYTAHGRLTGYVLMGLPAALAVVLSFINAEHMNLLFRERMGQMMLTGAIVLQIVGYIWIKRVVKIEV
jgi:tight adherence protein B